MIIKVIIVAGGEKKREQEVKNFDTGQCPASSLEVSLGFSRSPDYVLVKGTETTSESGCKKVTPNPGAALTPFPWAAVGQPFCLLLPPRWSWRSFLSVL